MRAVIGMGGVLPGAAEALFLFFKIDLFLAVLGLHCCLGFSLVSVSRGSPVVAMCRLLIAVDSLVAEHGSQGFRAAVVAAHVLCRCGFQALEHKLSCCGAQA